MKGFILAAPSLSSLEVCPSEQSQGLLLAPSCRCDAVRLPRKRSAANIGA